MRPSPCHSGATHFANSAINGIHHAGPQFCRLILIHIQQLDICSAASVPGHVSPHIISTAMRVSAYHPFNFSHHLLLFLLMGEVVTARQRRCHHRRNWKQKTNDCLNAAANALICWLWHVRINGYVISFANEFFHRNC